ncbi:MAG TPA: hypothetical protein VFB08_12295 [Burkholderiales bacterium]|nr:hypothetical protein [Burkholderiales bacterium]
MIANNLCALAFRLCGAHAALLFLVAGTLRQSLAARQVSAPQQRGASVVVGLSRVVDSAISTKAVDKFVDFS